MRGNLSTHDNYGRLKFNPELHDKHDMPWLTTDETYLINNYYKDGAEAIALALGRTTATVADKAYRLRKSGRLVRPDVVTYQKTTRNSRSSDYV